MKKFEYLIDKIVDLKIDLFKEKNLNERLKNENKAHEIMAASLKLELTNLRLALNDKQENNEQ
jgi:hypothetical protein